jgi:hypothetical protein
MDLLRRLRPMRALAVLAAVLGTLVVHANAVSVDESRGLGVALIVLGMAGMVLRETPGLRHLLEGVIVLTLILAGGESTLRRENAIAARAYAERTMHFVEDPVLRYEMKPGVACGGNGDERTNDRGMLDPPRLLEKPPGTIRVACLGDSVGGDCSLPHDNACAALEGMLREARGGKPVEVLNFSVPGYNTMQEARSLELKALPFGLDAVVVLYVINDPYPDLAISHFLPGNFKFEHLLWNGAHFAAWKLVGPPLDPFGGFLEELHENPKSWDAVVVAGFDRIHAVAEPRHLPVVVAVFPLFVPSPTAAQHAVYAKVANEAERHGFSGIDLSEVAFKNEPVSALLKPSRDMIHPNARAHHLAAEAIAHALLAKTPELAQ